MDIEDVIANLELDGWLIESIGPDLWNVSNPERRIGVDAYDANTLAELAVKEAGGDVGGEYDPGEEPPWWGLTNRPWPPYMLDPMGNPTSIVDEQAIMGWYDRVGKPGDKEQRFLDTVEEDGWQFDQYGYIDEDGTPVITGRTPRPGGDMNIDQRISRLLSQVEDIGNPNDKNLLRAQAFFDFKNQPTKADRLQTALQIAKSPADYMTLVGLYTGALKMEDPIGYGERIAPLAPFLQGIARQFFLDVPGITKPIDPPDDPLDASTPEGRLQRDIELHRDEKRVVAEAAAEASPDSGPYGKFPWKTTSGVTGSEEQAIVEPEEDIGGEFWSDDIVYGRASSPWMSPEIPYSAEIPSMNISGERISDPLNLIPSLGGERPSWMDKRVDFMPGVNTEGIDNSGYVPAGIPSLGGERPDWMQKRVDFMPGVPDYQQGGQVTGFPGEKKLITAEAGEVILPNDPTVRNQMLQKTGMFGPVFRPPPGEEITTLTRPMLGSMPRRGMSQLGFRFRSPQTMRGMTPSQRAMYQAEIEKLGFPYSDYSAIEQRAAGLSGRNMPSLRFRSPGRMRG